MTKVNEIARSKQTFNCWGNRERSVTFRLVRVAADETRNAPRCSETRVPPNRLMSQDQKDRANGDEMSTRQMITGDETRVPDGHDVETNVQTSLADFRGLSIVLKTARHAHSLRLDIATNTSGDVYDSSIFGNRVVRELFEQTSCVYVYTYCTYALTRKTVPKRRSTPVAQASQIVTHETAAAMLNGEGKRHTCVRRSVTTIVTLCFRVSRLLKNV